LLLNRSGMAGWVFGLNPVGEFSMFGCSIAVAERARRLPLATPEIAFYLIRCVATCSRSGSA
jgi:hypothetical protein